MPKGMSESERKDKPRNMSVPVRVCPEFHNLIKDVQMRVPGVHSDAQASKVIFDQSIFDVNMARFFQGRKKV